MALHGLYPAHDPKARNPLITIRNIMSQTLRPSDTLGRTFFDYVNDQRIETAMGWLKETDMSVLDIAIAAGFNSRSTFHKAFWTRVGRTPQDDRKGWWIDRDRRVRFGIPLGFWPCASAGCVPASPLI